MGWVWVGVWVRVRVRVGFRVSRAARDAAPAPSVLARAAYAVAPAAATPSSVEPTWSGLGLGG